MRVAYLGPPGTFSEEAVRASGRADGAELLPQSSIPQTVLAVQEGRADLALVPIENRLEGGVNATLDTLADGAVDVVVVGEQMLAIRNCLIAREPLCLDQIRVVVSHPQPLGQCARFLREQLPSAEIRVAGSTAEAVQTIARDGDGWAALGPRTAAELYGCHVLREGIDDDPDNATRFVWLAPAGSSPLEAPNASGWKTSVVFTGAGDEQPGWLVRCLSEFAFRGVNLTRIESRPSRGHPGRYLFHIDVEGSVSDESVSGALAGLASHCELVRVLGSYPAA